MASGSLFPVYIASERRAVVEIFKNGRYIPGRRELRPNFGRTEAESLSIELYMNKRVQDPRKKGFGSFVTL